MSAKFEQLSPPFKKSQPGEELVSGVPGAQVVWEEGPETAELRESMRRSAEEKKQERSRALRVSDDFRGTPTAVLHILGNERRKIDWEDEDDKNTQQLSSEEKFRRKRLREDRMRAYQDKYAMFSQATQEVIGATRGPDKVATQSALDVSLKDLGDVLLRSQLKIQRAFIEGKKPEDSMDGSYGVDKRTLSYGDALDAIRDLQRRITDEIKQEKK